MLATGFVFKFLVCNKEGNLFSAVLRSLHFPSEPSYTKIFVTRQQFLFQNFSNKFWCSQKWDTEVFYAVSQFYFYRDGKRASDADVDNTAVSYFLFLPFFFYFFLSSVSSFSFIYSLFIFTNISFFLSSSFLSFFLCIFVSFFIYFCHLFLFPPSFLSFIPL
jgi:hypothetical protein